MNEFPTTAEEWWGLVLANLDSLAAMAAAYHPKAGNHGKGRDLPRMAPVCDPIREIIRQEGPMLFDPPVELRKAVDEKRAEDVWRILNDTWFGTPDHPSTRSLPGFFALCDLCSEGHLVYGSQDD